MANISIDDLAAEITQAVREYTQDVSEAIDRKVDEVANEVRDAAERGAPKNKGKYAKAFKVTRQGNRRVIWNKKYYRLVHLNEFGHAKVNGGRVPGKPHLRPAYDRIATKLPDEIAQIIRNGG